MKLNINKNIEKRIYIAGLTLACLTTNGCGSINNSNLEVHNMKQNISENETNTIDILPIALAEDTQNVLKAYNKYFHNQTFPKTITLADLEYLSSLNENRAIKREDGSYAQFSLDNYSVIYDEDKNIQLILTSYIENRSDILTGEKISESITSKNKINVKEFLEKNNITFSAYTFPTNIGWSDKEKEMIIKKYGEEMFFCIQEYGIPVKMYEAADFKTNSNVKIK